VVSIAGKTGVDEEDVTEDRVEQMSHRRTISSTLAQQCTPQTSSWHFQAHRWGHQAMHAGLQTSHSISRWCSRMPVSLQHIHIAVMPKQVQAAATTWAHSTGALSQRLRRAVVPSCPSCYVPLQSAPKRKPRASSCLTGETRTEEKLARAKSADPRTVPRGRAW